LEQALTGLVRDHHRRLVAMQLAHSDFLEEQLDALSADIARLLTELSATPPTAPAASVGATGAVGSAAEPPPLRLP
jgi:hypothetical protein